jgi:hypothetical protein
MEGGFFRWFERRGIGTTNEIDAIQQWKLLQQISRLDGAKINSDCPNRLGDCYKIVSQPDLNKLIYSSLMCGKDLINRCRSLLI